MAEKGFGVKEINLIGPSGTPTIESPNNLNLNANNVAISTNVSIGGTLTVTGNVSVGGTLTYEDVTNIDSVGIITARSDVIVGRGLTVTGISTFSGDVHFSLHNAGNPKIQFDESGNLLWFKAPTVGGTSSKLWLGNGTSYNNLELVTDYTGGGLAQINVSNANLIIRTNNTGKNIELQSQNDLTLANGVYPFIKGEKNSSSDQSVTLYYGQTGSTPYANPKLETTSTGVNVTGAITVNGSALSIDPTNSDIQVVYNVTANGASAYRFAGNGVVSTADNPDLYLIRGQKYRFVNNSGGSHPFQIRMASGGAAYSTGVTNNGASSGNIDFAPTFDSPSHLYYQCTSHGGMVGNLYIRGASGQNTNVGVTTFTSNIVVQANPAEVRIQHAGNSSYSRLISDNQNALNIYTGGGPSLAVKIGTEGNLALGGTNTSAYSNQAHFFIGGVGDLYGDKGTSSGKSLSLSNNAYINTSGNWVYRATDKATNIYQYDGITGFRYAASGTAGNTISWSEACRINNNGIIHIGTTVEPQNGTSGIEIRPAGSIRMGVSGTGGSNLFEFNNPNGNVGKIVCSGSSTAYQTSSDYRLKENVVAISDGITRLKTLKPSRFNFKADAKTTVDGFLAHEVTPAVPEAISGTKDEVDSDNNPVYQGIDQSKLVPLLTAALQEAIAEIETLKTKVAALEGS